MQSHEGMSTASISEISVELCSVVLMCHILKEQVTLCLSCSLQDFILANDRKIHNNLPLTMKKWHYLSSLLSDNSLPLFYPFKPEIHLNNI